jgi:hypothetical protein
VAPEADALGPGPRPQVLSGCLEAWGGLEAEALRVRNRAEDQVTGQLHWRWERWGLVGGEVGAGELGRAALVWAPTPYGVGGPSAGPRPLAGTATRSHAGGVAALPPPGSFVSTCSTDQPLRHRRSSVSTRMPVRRDHSMRVSVSPFHVSRSTLLCGIAAGDRSSLATRNAASPLTGGTVAVPGPRVGKGRSPVPACAGTPRWGRAAGRQGGSASGGVARRSRRNLL